MLRIRSPRTTNPSQTNACFSCRWPSTVKKAISKVEGVSKIDVTFETREAVVTFDDAKTSVQKLTKATGDAGYPSSVKQ